MRPALIWPPRQSKTIFLFIMQHPG